MFLIMSVPFEPVLRSKWKMQIEKHQPFDEIPISYPICALHFDKNCIIKRGKKTNLVNGTVPTIFPTE